MQYQSGSSQTASYLIPSLQLLDESVKNCCQTLILCPTRDRGQIVHRMCSSLARFMTSPNSSSKSKLSNPNSISLQGVTSAVIIGGTATRQDIKSCEEGKQIIIGTPGRIDNLIDRQVLDLKKLTLLVLDEFDEMLSRGFKEQIEDILSHIPKYNSKKEKKQCQIVIFSRTIPKEITLFGQKYLDQNNTLKFTAYNQGVTLDGIVQSYVMVEKENYKYATLRDMFDCLNIDRMHVIIYCNTRRKVNWLAQQMRKDDFTGMLYK